MFKDKKIENLNNNKGNEQVENNKTTTNNKAMQTQWRGKWTWYKWIVVKKCLRKKKLETQTTSGKWISREQEDNDKE